MFRKLGTLYRTIQHLKIRQFIYRVFYATNVNKILAFRIVINEKRQLNFFQTLKSRGCFSSNTEVFTFLNKVVRFDNEIDWNFSANGKLWTYNLCYLDFLNQEDIEKNQVNNLLDEFYFNYPIITLGNDPYPTSLRIINLIKLSSRRYGLSENLDKILHEDINRLYHSVEYHLLGNHILENAFALYFAAHKYPENKRIYKKAVSILTQELEEQISKDGAHFERSLMYHQLILGRLLESISLSKTNPYSWNIQFLDFLIEKAEEMLGWLNTITQQGKVFLRFNDSIEGIAPNTIELLKLSEHLKLNPKPTQLSNSGFRVFKNNELLMITNNGGVISDYQPGHSHANTFSFVIFHQYKPIVVDPGITTYEESQKRLNERSTRNHNTININGLNNNEIWHSFRVGRRARVKIIQDEEKYLEAIHDGFSNINIKHYRSWNIGKDFIKIKDKLIGKGNKHGEFNIHLHPDVVIQKISDSKVLLNGNIVIEFTSQNSLNISSYEYSYGFNNSVSAKKIHGSFCSDLETLITIK